MKIFGILLIIVSLLVGLFALNMNVSVPTYIGRVVNIGLLQQQQNYLYISGLGLLVGIILSVFVKSSKKSKDNTKLNNNFEETKTEKGFNYKLQITDEVNFTSVKEKILVFYKELSFVTKTDNDESLFIKNDVDNWYVEVKNMESYLKISVYNTIEPLFIKDLYVKEVNNDNTKMDSINNSADKLIELGKMYKDGLLTREEFEEQKNLLKNK